MTLLLQQQQQQQQQQQHEHQQHLQLQLQQEQQHLQEQQAFDEEMASHSEYANSTQGYEWSQEHSPTTGSNQIASSLSLDMLLSLGTASGPPPTPSLSSGSVTGSSMTSVPDPTMSDFYSSLQQQQLQHQQQQHYHSLSLSSIPLISYSSSSEEEYAISPATTNAASSSSLVLSTQQSSLPNASHLPQQTYYELLMAANPNEPLSQLLSTSAASMTSTCFTATAASSIPTTVASSSLPLDSYNSDSVVSSSSASTATAGSMAVIEAPTAEQILTSVASAYSMASFPLGSMEPSQQQQQQQQQQQTVPLTTKEIMDALSGQFPIQPVMTSIVTEVVPPTVASVILSASAETITTSATASPLTVVKHNDGIPNSTNDSTAAAVSLQGDKNSATVQEPIVLSSTLTTTAELGAVSDVATIAITPAPEETVASVPDISIGIRHEQQQDESWESDVDVLSPPSLVYAQDTDDEGSSPTAILSSVTSPPAQVDLEMSEMTLTSPPLSPSRPSRMLKRSKSLAAVSSGQSVDNTSQMSTTSQRRKSRRITRRYQAVSESSSFSARLDMSTESEVMELAEQPPQQQQDIHQQQQQVATMPPKRRRPSDDDTSESPCSSPESSPPSPRTPPPSSALPSLSEDLHHHHHHLHHTGTHTIVDQEIDPSKRFKVEEVQAGVEGEDAGVLSPLLLTRSSKRQSSRLLRRTSGRIVQSTHSATDISSPSGHALSSSPSRGKVSAA
ncbi:hypothetical protein EC991_004629 [Linnemannia zychae]|nr:hypothetical protein EC991_004629 [Linnemannia zychae]